MAIVATRDGTVLRADPIGENQKELLWAMIFRAYLEAHPEENTAEQAAAGASTTPA